MRMLLPSPGMRPQDQMRIALANLEQINVAMIEQYERSVDLNQRLQEQCERMERVVRLAEAVVGEGVSDGD